MVLGHEDHEMKMDTHSMFLPGASHDWQATVHEDAKSRTGLSTHMHTPFLLVFSYCAWGSQGKNAEMVHHVFCQNSPPRWSHFGWPYLAWLIKLHKAMIHVVILLSFL